MKKITLIGATGLIGKKVLHLLAQHDDIEPINVIVRRDAQLKGNKVNKHIIDFEDIAQMKKIIDGSDAVICTVGTTKKKVKGDKSLYRKVDFDIPVHAAQCCQLVGCPHFLVVSSVGADASSKNFYLRLKGEMELAIEELELPQFSVFRPSMLLGDRKEFRFGEKVGQYIMRALKIFIPTNYKPIHAREVAQGIVKQLDTTSRGKNILHNKEIWELTKAH